MIQEAIGAKTLEAWEPVFRENDIWFAKVQSVQEVIDDEQVAMALLDLEASAADVAAAEREGVAAADVSLRTVASPVDFDSVISQPRAPVPSVGEHTAEILAEAGVESEVVGRILAAAEERTRKLAEAKAADPNWKSAEASPFGGNSTAKPKL